MAPGDHGYCGGWRSMIRPWVVPPQNTSARRFSDLRRRLFRRGGWLLQPTPDSVNLRGYAPALLPAHHSRDQSTSSGSSLAVLACSGEHRLEAADRRSDEDAASSATGQRGPGLLGSHEVCPAKLGATAPNRRAGHRCEVAPRALSALLDPPVATEARSRAAEDGPGNPQVDSKDGSGKRLGSSANSR